MHVAALGCSALLPIILRRAEALLHDECAGENIVGCGGLLNAIGALAAETSTFDGSAAQTVMANLIANSSTRIDSLPPEMNTALIALDRPRARLVRALAERLDEDPDMARDIDDRLPRRGLSAAGAAVAVHDTHLNLLLGAAAVARRGSEDPHAAAAIAAAVHSNLKAASAADATTHLPLEVEAAEAAEAHWARLHTHERQQWVAHHAQLKRSAMAWEARRGNYAVHEAHARKQLDAEHLRRHPRYDATEEELHVQRCVTALRGLANLGAPSPWATDDVGDGQGNGDGGGDDGDGGADDRIRRPADDNQEGHAVGETHVPEGPHATHHIHPARASHVAAWLTHRDERVAGAAADALRAFEGDDGAEEGLLALMDEQLAPAEDTRLDSSHTVEALPQPARYALRSLLGWRRVGQPTMLFALRRLLRMPPSVLGAAATARAPGDAASHAECVRGCRKRCNPHGHRHFCKVRCGHRCDDRARLASELSAIVRKGLRPPSGHQLHPLLLQIRHEAHAKWRKTPYVDPHAWPVHRPGERRVWRRVRNATRHAARQHDAIRLLRRHAAAAGGAASAGVWPRLGAAAAASAADLDVAAPPFNGSLALGRGYKAPGHGRALGSFWDSINFDDYSLTFLDLVIGHPSFDWHRQWCAHRAECCCNTRLRSPPPPQPPLHQPLAAAHRYLDQIGSRLTPPPLTPLA